MAVPCAGAMGSLWDSLLNLPSPSFLRLSRAGLQGHGAGMGCPCARLELEFNRSLSWIRLSVLHHSSSSEDHTHVAGFGGS